MSSKDVPQARMKDGQHLNDSLIDLFVSMLVSHPHVLGIGVIFGAVGERRLIGSIMQHEKG